MTNEELTLWIEQNHRLVRKKANYWINNSEYLDMTYDEAYSLALEYVLKAAKRFDKSKGYKFSTYAGMAIDNAFKCNIRTIKNQKKYITYEISLNDVTFDSEGNETENINLIADENISVEDEATINALISYVREIACSRVKRGGEIFDLMILGYKQREIGRELGISQTHCSRLVHRIMHLAKIEISKQNTLSGLQSEDLRL